MNLPTRVRHFGNTANNAYYNALLLQQAGIASEFPIRMFGLQHAMSAPAWESTDFEVPDAGWVSSPDWAMFPDAAALNLRFSDLPPAAKPGSVGEEASSGSLAGRAMSTARRALAPLYGKRGAQPIFDASYHLLLKRRPDAGASPAVTDIFYGADSIMHTRPSAAAPYACLEHGTVRWIADGARESAVLRRAYRGQVGRAARLWVTNLDPRTLEVAEDVAPGRWSAFPHPFVPDDRVPFSGSVARRNELLSATRAQFLIQLPSSQNWTKTHDKGSIKALKAFVQLRQSGVDVGLVAVEWGLQLEESKAFLSAAGVAENVVWFPPMARLGLQKMMADVDVVWDQFGLDAFGALALRAVEQGTPMVSRGLLPVSEQLIGGSVPWLPAADVDEIVVATTSIFEDMGRRGRAAVIEETRKRYRGWLFTRHAPTIAADMQREAYGEMANQAGTTSLAAPDRWARLLAKSAGEEDGLL